MNTTTTTTTTTKALPTRLIPPATPSDTTETYQVESLPP